MKVGLSLSKCVVDIFLEKVDYYGILVITTGTRFDPTIDSEWKSIWRGYSTYNGVWEPYVNEEATFKQIVLDLHYTGKLHQPRNFSGTPYRDPLSRTWYDVMPVIDEIESNPTLANSWHQFKTLAALTGAANIDNIGYHYERFRGQI
jgi:hypothetical protein